MSAPVLSVDEHLADILARVQPLSPYPQPLLDGLGLPVAEDITSSIAMPGFDNSAMDGYAVRAVDVAHASEDSPVVLPVTGEIHAGPASVRHLAPSTAVRIMTGAAMPAGADSVVPFEWTDSGAQRVSITRASTEGQHIRRAGEDIRVGDQLIRTGEVLGPRQVALLAAAGRDTVAVAPKPRVVVISTGAELVEPGRALPRDSIYDSNSYMLTAAVRAAGYVAYRVRATSDDPASFREALEDQLVRADAVITTGGVSMGTRDVVKEALRDLGTVAFRSVLMQPGKPQGFGFVGSDHTPIFALPGNPVSAYISFEVFVAPALRRLVGRTQMTRPLFRAQLASDVTSPAGKRQFLRGHFTSGPAGPTVTLVGGPGSHLLGGLAAANALVVINEQQTSLAAGDAVPVMLLDRDY